jgi:DNA repair protein RecN (Recombination protein N)
MLTHLHISNFTIIDELDLDLRPGMTTLTGETGAGKSIIIDALGLILGGRADSSLVRFGSQRCDISATFSLPQDSPAYEWLRQQELDQEGECLVRRTLSQDGKSRAFINGQPATLQQLKELGENLINIHGQHEHQSLQKKDRQRQVLDAFAGLQILATRVKGVYQRWHSKQLQLGEMRQQATQKALQQEYLQFQVQELAALNLQPLEIPLLQQEQQLLANVDKILQTGQQTLAVLFTAEEGNALQCLQLAQNYLANLSETDARLATAVELLNGAIIQAEEATAELKSYLKHVEADPNRLQQVEDRLSILYELARKHKVQPEQLTAHLQRLSDELKQVASLDEQCLYLQTEIADLEAEYLQIAQELSAKRQTAASQLANLITEQMQGLAMAGGQFAVQLQACSEYQAMGLESVEFLVSANPGYPLQALAKVASGGELSRISLAIQVITAQFNPVPSLIFDEVDVGIGGGTAEVVGRLLRSIGSRRQVLCVTHLAQVAAQGHQHLQVEKRLSQQTTITRIIELDSEQRINEIARMLGGVDITAQTLAHAKEMLARVA